MKTKNKSYDELIKLPTYEERLGYLQCFGTVGAETFGWDRYVNQQLYSSKEWRDLRRRAVIRDNGCDMALEGFPLGSRFILHHINPIDYDDIVECRPCAFDLNNVICVTLGTHNAIHYGNEKLASKSPIERTANDTCPWKR